MRVPHPIPYQGSKRRLAEAILSQMPERRLNRLVEPFAGSGAVTLACATQRRFESYLLADVLEPLCRLWRAICTDPADIGDSYEKLWNRERNFQSRHSMKSEQSSIKTATLPNYFICWYAA